MGQTKHVNGVRLGFTLLELMVVLAIFAVVGAVGATQFGKRTEKTAVEKSGRDLAGRITYARALAESAGPRAQLNPVAPCPITGLGGPIAVRIDPTTNTYTAPVDIQHNPATNVTTVTCRTYNVTQETRNLGTMSTRSNAAITLVFTGMGRVDLRESIAVNRPLDFYFRVFKTDNPVEGFSFRVLPSGILCRSGTPDTIACSEE